MKKALLSLLCTILTITAKGQVVNGICYYKLDDSHVSVVVDQEWDSQSSTMIRHDYKGQLSIPPSVVIDNKTYTVTRVDLYGCPELTGISLPNTLEEIAEAGFSDCSSLTHITLPSSLKKIGRFAFQSCDNLQELTIPASVQEIGMNAFCTFSDNFKKLTITDLAAWCDIEMEGIVLTDGTVYLNDKPLTDLVIPEGVKTIKPYVFCGFKGITSVHIPACVDSIGYNAFMGCTSITKVSADDIASWCGIHFGPTTILNTGNPLNLSNPVFYSENLYIGGSSITELTIPEGVDSIGSCAFINLKSLTKVSLPSTLKYVGPNAFQDCVNLMIADVTSIRDYCGIEFASLDSNPFQDYIRYRAFTWLLVNGNYVHEGNRVLSIPDGITEVKANAFANADPTETVIIPASVTKIGTNAFRNSVTNRFHTLCIKGHIEDMGELAFGSCPFINTIYMEDLNPSAIPANTFTNYYIPPTNQTLGADYNYKHTKLMVPAGTKSIYESTDGWNLFENIEEYDVAAVNGIGLSNAATTEFTLDGRPAGPDYKGIILVRMPDGTVRKELRK